LEPLEPDRIEASAVEVARRVATGHQAGNWVEAEVVLAMLILVYANPSRLGGSKPSASGKSLQHPAVRAAATALGRSEGAVVLKVMNLRAELTGGHRGMAHGGRLDSWVVNTFTNRLDALMRAALVVANRLPGAQEVMRALGQGPLEAAEDATGVADGVPPWPTTLMREVVTRRGQGLFRGRVMANYEHACAFCGLRARRPARSSSLLVASHILPWKDATDHQRLDPRNGLALCGTHDRAFDWGLMTLDESQRIVVSRALREDYEPVTRIEADFMALHGAELHHGLEFIAPHETYVEHHRQRVFEQRFRSSR